MTDTGTPRPVALGTMDNSSLAKWVSLELHTDGSGAYGVCVLDLLERHRQRPVQEGEPQPQMIHDEAPVIAVLSGLLHLARHARDRAAAGGNALIRAQIYPISPQRSTELGHLHPQGFTDSLGTAALTKQPPVAEAAAALDDLAQSGNLLTQASALLVNEIGHVFGIAELGQISRDGRIRRRYWAHTPITTWAEQRGIGITEDIGTWSP